MSSKKLGIRKADDLFVVMWLSKDTLEITSPLKCVEGQKNKRNFDKKNLIFIETSDIIYT